MADDAIECEGIEGCDPVGDPITSSGLSAVDNPLAEVVDITLVVHESDGSTEVFTFYVVGDGKGRSMDEETPTYQYDIRGLAPTGSWNFTGGYRYGEGFGPLYFPGSGGPTATVTGAAVWEKDNKLVVTLVIDGVKLDVGIFNASITTASSADTVYYPFPPDPGNPEIEQDFDSWYAGLFDKQAHPISPEEWYGSTFEEKVAVHAEFSVAAPDS